LQKNFDVQKRFVRPEYCDFFNGGKDHRNRAEGNSLAVKNAPWVAGEFVWTGFDYIGEPSFGWPARSSCYGVVDLCGFPKDRFYFYQSIWTDKPMVHVMPHWTWPGFEGKPIPVWVYSNAKTVELFLNNRSLGEKKIPDDYEQFTNLNNEYGNGTMHLAWSVPYEPGVLKAVAKNNGQVVATDEIHTAGPPAKLSLTADRSQIMANGQDLSYIKITVLDHDGNVCPNAAPELEFKLAGNAAILAGLDNGDPNNHEFFQGTRHQTFHGLALAVLKSLYDKPGTVTLTVAAPGMAPVSTTVDVVK
jgi:beta-galactosidase